MLQFNNLTPHTINIRSEKGTEYVIRASGNIARVNVKQTIIDRKGNIPIIKNQWGEIEGLPDPEEDFIVIVSSLVLSRVPSWRKDVFAPDTGKTAIRFTAEDAPNPNLIGKIKAVTRLVSV